MSAIYRPFDVVAVTMGEGGAAKRRPALVVSNPDFEKSTGMVWIAMITTAAAVPQAGACGPEEGHGGSVAVGGSRVNAVHIHEHSADL